MRVDVLLQLLFIMFIMFNISGASAAASSDCKSYEAGKKVVCSNMELRQVLPPDSFPNITVTLTLSNNKIQELTNGSFIGLSTLERLDLRSNVINHIEPGAFLGLPALKKLDLSKNKIGSLSIDVFKGLTNLGRLDLSKNEIGCLNVDVFKGLTNLARLILSGNKFSSLTQGTFDSFLVSLKTIEFDTGYLLCDCNLQWVLRWIKDRNIGVKDTKCSFPRALQGKLVTSINPELLTCDAPLELPSFQLTPSQRQVVFQGDSLPFQCQASFVAEDMQVLWYQDGRMVEPDAAQGIFIEKSMVQNCSLIASALTISNIQPGSTGNWECRVWTSRGNTTRTVHIVVLESSAKYCAPERVSNNKGEFRWTRTLAGITAYLPCNRLSGSAGISGEEQRAWRRCDRRGVWAEEDYSRCQYQKDVTRFLYVINQIPLNVTNVVTRARQLLVCTDNAANFSDKMDIIFVAEMIEKFSKFSEKFKDLGEVIVSMASNLMLADERVLWMAQREAKACTRIIACLQKVAAHRLVTAQTFPLTSTNIALDAHMARASDWTGMTCMLFQRPSPERRSDSAGPQDRQLTLKCNTTFSSMLHKNTVVEATLQLPQSLLSQTSPPPLLPPHATAAAATATGQQPDEAVYRLHLLAFRNGKFFPSTSNSSGLADGGKRRSIATPVLMARMEGVSLSALRSPVNITLRRFARGSDAVAASWNGSLAGGQGGWQTDGCRILAHHDNFTTISCDALGNYGLMMDLSSVEYFSPSIQPLHPVIYATTIVLLLCLLTIIISYIYHHRSVRVSRKFWHMLVNLCLHIFLTCGVFVGGVNQTRYASVCQAVGILLHYSTLATALWVGVTARNIYKQLTRKAKRYEELDEPPPPPRPMLRFYLIGGGIPIIVCGITAAANIKNYGSRTNAPYCWMSWEPSIGAFYGPVGFIVFVDCMYFLSILLQLRRHPERRYEFKELTEEQQRLALSGSAHDGVGEADAHLQRPLTGLQAPLQNQNPHEASSSSVSASGAPPPPRPLPAVALSALENEHTFAAQLAGAAAALGLYGALWVFGAMAVSREHPVDLAFTCLFGVAALALGAFLVAHHCVNRQDMRRFWSQACCSGRRAYSAHEEDVLLPSGPQTAGAGTTAASSTAGSLSRGGNGEAAKHGLHSSAESSCTNRSAAHSVRNSAGHGSKLTNLHAEAALQGSKSTPLLPVLPASNGNAPNANAALLDNSLTEHSLDNEIKMHTAPTAETVQFLRPTANNNHHNHHHHLLPASATVPPPNGQLGRNHHKNRARAHRANRLTVLREYAYDVPTSVEGSVQSAPGPGGGGGSGSGPGPAHPPRRHHHQHHHDVAARNSRRAAYMAYRERHQSQLHQDSSDSASLPRRARTANANATAADKGGAKTLDNGVAGGVIVTIETELSPDAVTAASSSTKDNGGAVKPPCGNANNVELESQLPKSYGLNLVTQNGGMMALMKENGGGQPLMPLISTECTASIKTGLWKHETTV